MKLSILSLICFCIVIFITACENNIIDNTVTNELSIVENIDASDKSEDIPKNDSLGEEYLPVEITAVISAGKPEYRFVKRMTGIIEEDNYGVIEEYLTAVIDVYEIGITEKLIDSVEILVYIGSRSSLFGQEAWESLYIVDVNFDGYKDIVVIESIGGNQAMHYYNCFTWNEELSKFEAAVFPDCGFVSVDTDRKMLLTAWRNHAGSHGWAIYEYIDDILTKTNECTREYLPVPDDEIAAIHLNATQLINGEMQIIFDGNVAEDELDEYLLYDNLWRLGSEDWVSVWTVNEIKNN